MKECTTIKREKLMHLMEQMNMVFDIVRIVDPYCTEVLTMDDDGKIHPTQESCFSVWEKDKRCNNCISIKACTDRRRRTKLEVREGELYSVISMPFLVEEGEDQTMVALELVNHVSEELFLHADGSGRIPDEIKVINRKLYEDSLTGIHNRRYFDENIYLMEMMRGMPRKICFILVDVRKFKQINDVYGHVSGDKVLHIVAQTLKGGLRKSDTVIRVGGDEFLIVLKECTEEFAQQKCIQLKEQIHKLDIDWMEGKSIDINVGYAYRDGFDGKQKQIEEMFDEADQKMYQDKKKKR